MMTPLTLKFEAPNRCGNWVPPLMIYFTTVVAISLRGVNSDSVEVCIYLLCKLGATIAYNLRAELTALLTGGQLSAYEVNR